MISKIEFHREPKGSPEDCVFSILIPSWNNLDYLKCCVASIKKNSSLPHQIIVHVNEGTDGTLEWVKSQGLAHSHSKDNVGVCYGFNAAASLSVCEYIVLSDDDFYFAPQWDRYLLDEIKNVGHPYFCITGTMIEHGPSQYDGILAPFNFGRTVETFEEERFLQQVSTIPYSDWTGGNWYPLALHSNLWRMIGGLSVEFTPGMASDPDMMMKLWHCGVRYYKGVSQSRVYHFGSKTTSRIRKNDGDNQFLTKWGLAKSTFFKYYLRLGQKFSGYTEEPRHPEFKTKLLRDKLKRLFSTWK